MFWQGFLHATWSLCYHSSLIGIKWDLQESDIKTQTTAKPEPIPAAEYKLQQNCTKVSALHRNCSALRITSIMKPASLWGFVMLWVPLAAANLGCSPDGSAVPSMTSFADRNLMPGTTDSTAQIWQEWGNGCQTPRGINWQAGGLVLWLNKSWFVEMKHGAKAQSLGLCQLLAFRAAHRSGEAAFRTGPWRGDMGKIFRLLVDLGESQKPASGCSKGLLLPRKGELGAKCGGKAGRGSGLSSREPGCRVAREDLDWTPRQRPGPEDSPAIAQLGNQAAVRPSQWVWVQAKMTAGGMSPGIAAIQVGPVGNSWKAAPEGEERQTLAFCRLHPSPYQQRSRPWAQPAKLLSLAAEMPRGGGMLSKAMTLTCSSSSGDWWKG